MSTKKHEERRKARRKVRGKARGKARREAQFGGKKCGAEEIKGVFDSATVKALTLTAPNGEEFTDEMREECIAFTLGLPQYTGNQFVLSAFPKDIDRVLLAGSFKKNDDLEETREYRSATGIDAFRAAPHLLLCIPHHIGHLDELEHHRKTTARDATALFIGYFPYRTDGYSKPHAVSVH